MRLAVFHTSTIDHDVVGVATIRVASVEGICDQEETKGKNGQFVHQVALFNTQVLVAIEILIPTLLFLLIVLIRTRNFDVDTPVCMCWVGSEHKP